jgi:hypothetical protein
MGLFGTVVGMIEIFGSQAPTGSNPTATGARHLDRALQHRLRSGHRDPEHDLLAPFPCVGRWLRRRHGAAGHPPGRSHARRPEVSDEFPAWPQREEPEINLIPMIDVLLVIIIFLMLTTTYAKFSGLEINLPTADAASRPSSQRGQCGGDGDRSGAGQQGRR